MFPGWNDSELFADPVVMPLPIPYMAVYADGDAGIVQRKSGAIWKAGWAYVDSGVRLVEGYSGPGAVPTLRVELVQPNVFGVLLFDWFVPPNENYTEELNPVDPSPDSNPGQDNGVNQPVFSDIGGATSPVYAELGNAYTPTFGDI